EKLDIVRLPTGGLQRAPAGLCSHRGVRFLSRLCSRIYPKVSGNNSGFSEQPLLKRLAKTIGISTQEIAKTLVVDRWPRKIAPRPCDAHAHVPNLYSLRMPINTGRRVAASAAL